MDSPIRGESIYVSRETRRGKGRLGGGPRALGSPTLNEGADIQRSRLWLGRRWAVPTGDQRPVAYGRLEEKGRAPQGTDQRKRLEEVV